MIDEVRALIDEYVHWLRDKTVLRQLVDAVEITTPYLDRHNDHLQIYAKRNDGGFLLTDDSYIIEDLRQTGCDLDTRKRRDLLQMTLNGFGVRRAGDALEVRASRDNFAQRKHNLVQAMLAVNDLFYLAVPTVASLFLEDVTQWLDLSEVRYTPQVKFTGKSGYDHLFDFVIPASRTQPERILEAINRPSRDAAQAVVFKWIDIREVRRPDARAYALLNNSDHDPPEAVLDALRNYDVRPVLWSDREKAKQELAA